MEDNSKLYQQSVESILKFIDMEYIDEALKMINALSKAFPDKVEDILRLKCEAYSKAEMEEEWIITLIELYELYNDETALSYLEEKYLDSVKNEILDIYNNNYNRMVEYRYYYGSLSQSLMWYKLYSSDKLIVAYNKELKKFRGWKNTDIDVSGIKSKIPLLSGVIFVNRIRQVIEATHILNGVNGMDCPIYLFYDECELQIILQMESFSEIIDSDRCFLLLEEKGISECFSDIYTVAPNYFISTKHDEDTIAGIMDGCIEASSKAAINNIESFRKYYKSSSEEIEKRIRSGNPRILFWTSRYTTVLQFHIRNMMEAAIKLGCNCELLMEPDGVRRLTDMAVSEKINVFRPDVIVMIDHFRFEQPEYIPNDILFVIWLQDPMPHVIDPCTYSKLTDKDVLINHFITWEHIHDLYPGRLIDAPVPSNEEVYKHYDLLTKEEKQFSADICFVCHASDVDDWIRTTLNEMNVPNDIREIVEDIFLTYQKMAYEGCFFYSEAEFRELIEKGFAKKGFVLNESGMNFLADNMFKWFNQRVFRQTIVDWIIEAGFDNIKLWGNGWTKNPKYAKYAMGPAENGETLSKIYQASKVVVGNNIVTTAAARAWESMLSGAFYLSNYIPPEYDWCDIRRIMPEGTVEFFRTKEELIDKLHYFIEHEDERRAIAKKCREEALKRMTFKALMEKVLNILPEYL